MELSVSLTGLDGLASKSKVITKIAKEEVGKALFASGVMVEKSAKESIAAGGKSGRIYRRGGVTHQASAPGEAPATDTGRLINSINVRPVDGELAVEVVAGGGIVNYARMLEHGTAKMAARPYFFPALEKNKSKIRARLESALDRTIDRAVDKAVAGRK